jgi:hypothetical protein
MYFLGFWQILFLSTLSDMTTGFYLACSFQVSHVVPQAKWPRMDKETGGRYIYFLKVKINFSCKYGLGSNAISNNC